MLKFVTGLTEHLMGLVLQPIDLTHLRAKPLDNMISIDGTPLGRADVRVIIGYAKSGTQARKWTTQRLRRNVSGTGSLTFSGTRGEQKLVGIILTEPDLVRFEQKPLDHVEMFDDSRYGIPNFKLMLTYGETNRTLVFFLRELGVPAEKIAADPALASLWHAYQEESRGNIERVLRSLGHELPADTSVLFNQKPESSGMSEAAILATRGQDIAYFAAHPTETEYYRRAVPGELPAEMKAEWVKVINVPESEAPRGESMRLKIPMNRIAGEFVEVKQTSDSQP